MPYTTARLLEALGVVREDRLRRDALEAQKIALTQYREGFNFRRSAVIPTQPVHVWRNDNTSDDDYDPDSKRKKRRKGRDNEYQEDRTKSKNVTNRRKRKILVTTDTGDQEDDSIDHIRKKPKIGDSTLDATEDKVVGHVFVTLNLKTERGQLFLSQKLREHQDTHINVYLSESPDHIGEGQSPWRSSRGGLHRVSQTTAAHFQDQELFNELHQPFKELQLDTPRTLRSGKVLEEITLKKRKSFDDEEMNDHDPGSSTLQYEEIVSKKRKMNANDDEMEHHDPGSSNSPWEEMLDSKHLKLQQIDLREPITSHLNFSCSPVMQIKQWQGLNIPSGTSAEDAISIGSSSSSNSTVFESTTPPTSTTLHSTPLTTPSSQTCHLTPQTPPSSPPCSSQPINKVITSFSHPIDFASLSASTCTFHTDYRHPILGHGEVVVRSTISPSKPSQIIELYNGHRSTGIPPDTMCVHCALSYNHIIRCTQHTFTRLPLDPFCLQNRSGVGKLYVQDLYTPLPRGHPERNTKPLIETCRLCPAPASFRCCEPQRRDRCLRPCRLPGESMEDAHERIDKELGRRDVWNTAQSLDSSSTLRRDGVPAAATAIATAIATRPQHQVIQPPIHGCGLILCSDCHSLVACRCCGRMEENRSTILSAVARNPLGARADIEFLFRDGLVWKAYQVDRI